MSECEATTSAGSLNDELKDGPPRQKERRRRRNGGLFCGKILRRFQSKDLFTAPTALASVFNMAVPQRKPSSRLNTRDVHAPSILRLYIWTKNIPTGK